MGILHYGGTDHELTDRTLAHLKIVITEKLRRHEVVLLGWTRPRSEGSGRVTMLIFPDAPLAFRFSSRRPTPVDRRWLKELRDAASTPEGIHLTPAETTGRAEPTE